MAERRESFTLAQNDIDSLKQVFEKDLSELVEDEGEMSDLLNFTVVMIQNGKTVSEMEKELHDIYGGEYSKRIGTLLVAYFEKNKLVGENKEGQATSEQADKSMANAPRVKSLKSSSEGNALTMSGALGSSREGGKSKTNRDEASKKTKDNSNSNKDEKAVHRNDKGDRRKKAFDRLTSEESRERRDTRKERGGRHGGRDNNRAGRGNRQKNGGRTVGYRRGRGEDEEIEEEEDFINTQHAGGRGGRSNFDARGFGRGRSNRGGRDGGRGGRFSHHGRGYSGDSSHKRRRVSDGGKSSGNGDADNEDLENQPFEAGHNHEDFPDDERYSYGGGYGNYRGGWGGRYGRGRGRGRGRFGGRGYGRFGDAHHADHQENGEGAEGGEEGENKTEEGGDGPNLSYSGRGYGRGRGHGRGRGRGFYRGGSGHVASMLASKSWVRTKKDGGNDSAEPTTE
mmetsp:Transcript_26440/g.39098  ORF Transcript_26440/g.39098 Transcript_26440/m.39098 type:complete len:453 (+) Transcript_26440:128-1486(+)